MRVCGDRKEYHEYGGPGGSAGYWNSGSEELVFYDASRSKKIDDDTVSVLYHEAFHQYIYYSVGNVAPHSWFNEGHGDYYAGADLKGAHVHDQALPLAPGHHQDRRGQGAAGEGRGRGRGGQHEARRTPTTAATRRS